MSEAESRYRWGWAIGLGCVIALWGVASWVSCSDLGLKLEAVPPVAILLALVAPLSWPAHEICLAIMGQGVDDNARVPTAFWTLAVFFIQAVVIWLPLIVPCVRKSRVKPWWIVQASVFLVLFLCLWGYDVSVIFAFCAAVTSPALMYAKWRRAESWWLLFAGVPGVVAWFLLVSSGYGPQSLSNIIEVYLLVIGYVILVYLKVLLVDHWSDSGKVTTAILSVLAVLGAVGLRTFMPLLPE